MENLVPSDILIHIINILVLFVLLRVILFKPVTKFLAARTERIAGELKDAEAKNAEALEMKAAYEKRIETYEEEGHEIIRASQVKASEEATAIVKDARGQAEKIIADAHQRIAGEKAQAVAEARTEVALLATEIAARILKREVSAVDNKAVAEDFFREVK
ncbi:F-type H+-transporting ATPase subunit b [Sporobacter termitidis DSM 10068]|uniref:ATP synthase subunit b n=1 Tax=Sporobacter termitidis DSM 10068 TaxID=1123282 RepID=A0A1M5VT92_9FIRM|nr:F0F1 ATP synthase subunit B [Sporobacter termitidis]SHH78485.1 F-type H+-transporting ATPase subunit b [Sporobacter termitidis DSM 10068]